MLKFLFRVTPFIFILLFSECREKPLCNMDLYNNYINISDSEMQSFKGFNNLIIKHFKDLTPTDNDNNGLMNLTPYEIRKGMFSDTSQFENHHKILQKYLSYIFINSNDTTLDYEISNDMCLGKKYMISRHTLVYSTSNKTIDTQNMGLIFIKQKSIDPYWTYFVKNEEYLGR
ncbi:MAG: hypothetical protein V4556_02915 [Bacteroidota bacterium]